MPLLRALLLAVLAALPARADAPADAPGRVAALSWDMAEIAADLDLPLAGVADPAGYATWVVSPPLPRGIAGLGLRTEPNLEALISLAPDLILGSDQQADMAERLSDVAPTRIVARSAGGPAAGTRETYLEIARAFGKEDLATRRLAEIDADMDRAGARVRVAWGGEVPPVLPVRLMTATTVRIHGPGSMAEAALKGMGLDPAATGVPGPWGFTLAPIEALADYPDAAIVQIDPFEDGDALYASPLWRAIPAVAAGRFGAAEPAWTFGSVVSLAPLSARLADALVAMAPHR